MYQRYRAMFTLRNRGDDVSAMTLCEGLTDPDSALFRHEVCFVLGQLANPLTKEALERVVRDENEHQMVRHEAIEALGAIGTEECTAILKEFVGRGGGEAQIVRETCDVALDASEYWRNFESGGNTE